MEPEGICASNRTTITTPCLMDEVPTAVLLKIFEYLPREMNLLVLPRVSQRWLEIQSVRPFFRDIRFIGKDPSTDECVLILTLAKCLRSLELIKRNDTNALLEVVGKCNPTIECLALTRCRGSKEVEDISPVHLNMIFTSCTALQELKLHRTSTNGQTGYANIGINLPHLTSIQLSFVPANVNNCLSSMASNCTHLKHVSLRSNDFNCCSAEVVGDLCERHKTTLETLDLNASEMTNKTMERIAQCSELTQLHLRNLQNVTREGIGHLRHLKKLRSLLIFDCPVSRERIIDLPKLADIIHNISGRVDRPSEPRSHYWR